MKGPENRAGIIARLGLSAAVLLGGGVVGGTTVADAQDRGAYLVEPGFCDRGAYLVPENSQISEEGISALEQIVREGKFANATPSSIEQQPIYTISTWGDPSVSLAELMGRGGEAFIYPFPINEQNEVIRRLEGFGSQTLEFGYNRVRNTHLEGISELDFIVPCPDADVYIRSLSNNLVMASLTEVVREDSPAHELRIIPSETATEIDLEAIIIPRNPSFDQPRS